MINIILIEINHCSLEFPQLLRNVEEEHGGGVISSQNISNTQTTNIFIKARTS